MYNDLKTFTSETLNLSKDALHVHVGLAIFAIVTLVLFRTRPATLWPWLAAFAAAVANEVMDIRGHLAVLSYWIEGAKDIVNTMLWPTVALVVLRMRAGSRKRLPVEKA